MVKKCNKTPKKFTKQNHVPIDSNLLSCLTYDSYLPCPVPSGTTGHQPICIPSPIQYYLAWDSEFRCRARGCSARRMRCMPMRRAIGIAFACLVTSACAVAETLEENITQSTGVTPGNSEMPT